jgi:hypothetical protein
LLRIWLARQALEVLSDQAHFPGALTNRMAGAAIL